MCLLSSSNDDSGLEALEPKHRGFEDIPENKPRAGTGKDDSSGVVNNTPDHLQEIAKCRLPIDR